MTELLSEQRTTEQVELELYNAAEFFLLLQESITHTQPGDRIALTTMCFEPSEPDVQNTFAELQKAAERGVDTVVAIDAYTLMLGNDKGMPGPAWLPLPFGQSTYKRRQEALDELAATPNMTLGITNRPKRLLSNPCADRSHLKIAIVNDQIFLGGPNMHGSHRADMVVGFEDPVMADQLFELAREIAVSEDTNATLGTVDHRYKLDADTEILLDAGQANQSVILDTALGLIDSAQEWITISGQFFPHGETSKHLARAALEREVSVLSIHNHPSAHGGLGGLWQKTILARDRSTWPGKLAGQLPKGSLPFHSALLATDQAGMKCSHNLIDTGVKWRTPEQALVRWDPLFGQALRNLVIEQFYCVGMGIEEQLKDPQAASLRVLRRYRS